MSVADAVELRFVTPGTPAYEQELELRFRVLREPLGHPRAAVAFPFESQSLHLVAVDESGVLGCVLFHPETAAEGRLFQMAVSPALQGSGIGRRLVSRLEAELRARGFRAVTLHARQSAVLFYEKLGYACEGAPFEEVGVPHRHMRKTL